MGIDHFDQQLRLSFHLAWKEVRQSARSNGLPCVWHFVEVVSVDARSDPSCPSRGCVPKFAANGTSQSGMPKPRSSCWFDSLVTKFDLHQANLRGKHLPIPDNPKIRPKYPCLNHPCHNARATRLFETHPATRIKKRALKKSGDGLGHDGFFGPVTSGADVFEGSTGHDADAITDCEKFGQIGTDEQNRFSVCGEFAHQAVDF